MSADRTGARRKRVARVPTVAEIAAELWNADHDDGKSIYGITLHTSSADRFAADNREAWEGYKDNARRVRRLLARLAREGRP